MNNLRNNYSPFIKPQDFGTKFAVFRIDLGQFWGGEAMPDHSVFRSQQPCRLGMVKVFFKNLHKTNKQTLF